MLNNPSKTQNTPSAGRYLKQCPSCHEAGLAKQLTERVGPADK
jgi:hypothetical protein